MNFTWVLSQNRDCVVFSELIVYGFVIVVDLAKVGEAKGEGVKNFCGVGETAE